MSIALRAAGDGQDGEAVERGLAFLREKRFEEAVPLLRQGLQTDPQNSLLWYRYGIGLMRCDRTEQAMRALENALFFNTGIFEAMELLGRLKQAAGEQDMALATLIRAWWLRPDRDDLAVSLPRGRIERRTETQRRARPVLTAIMHFFNEIELLPFWIAHHRDLFDHVVFIDYASTDGSAELCRRLAPDWEVRPSRHTHFSATLCDQEVMEIERETSGWKIALNVTEFLHVDRQGLDAFMVETPTALAFRAAIMVCPDAQVGEAPRRGQSLVEHFPFGLYDIDYVRLTGMMAMRNRILHNLPHARYAQGRHVLLNSFTAYVPKGLILWYGFSPWNDAILARKLQIQTRIPDSDRRQRHGIHHFVDRTKLEDKRREIAPHVVDIRHTGPSPSLFEGMQAPEVHFAFHEDV